MLRFPMRPESGGGQRYCDGLSRRSFVQLGMAGMGSLGLSSMLRARSASAATAGTKRDTAVIMVWLDGGPSHLDLYDMKPEAPLEYRGLWRPVSTNVPGMEISELLPAQTKVADKFSILRSLHHDNGDHFTAAHYMLTSYGGPSGANTLGKNPSLCAVASRVVGSRKPGIPAHVAVPYASSVGLRPGYFGANYIGQEHNPFETGGDPNAEKFDVQNLGLAGGLSIERLQDRRQLQTYFDNLHRGMDRSGMAESMDRFQRQAFDMVAGAAAREAFDIGREDPRLREQYGRDSFGQSMLLARRLVEAGVTFVTVHSGGWDHHWDLKAGLESRMPSIDKGYAALLQDLGQRGLWDRVLVILCGEFSRTPRMNDGGNGGAPMSKGTPGRDHWGNAMFCLLGGGGVKGGRVIGSTNRLGEVPQDRPVTCGDLHASIYHVLGIDPHVAFVNHAGRPTLAIEKGEVIPELF